MSNEASSAWWYVTALTVLIAGLEASRPNVLQAEQYGVLPPEALTLAEQYNATHPFDAQHQSPWTEAETGPLRDAQSVGPRRTDYGSGSNHPPLWYWENNIRIINRSRARMVPFTIDQGVMVGGQLVGPVLRMTSRSVTFDIAAGYDTTIGHYLGRDADNRNQFVEFTFWGTNNWFESRTVAGSRQLTAPSGGIDFVFGALDSLLPTEVTGFNRADSHSIVYSSDINNFELNARISPRGRPDRMVLKPNGHWRREPQPGQYWSYLFGLRTLLLDEIFGWSANGVVSGGGTSTVTSGNYDVNTHNQMVGAQIGAEVMFRDTKFSWGSRVKAAPMVNFADQLSRIRTSGAAGDPFATVDLNNQRFVKNDGLSFIGEVSLLANYRFTDIWVAHVGYHFVWITGLARAAEQVASQAVPPLFLNDNGHVFDSGLTLGLEAIW